MCCITGMLCSRGDEKRLLPLMPRILDLLHHSEERGRDGMGYVYWDHWDHFGVPHSMKWVGGPPQDYQEVSAVLARAFIWIANHRAEPTTEFVLEKKEADQQPYVHRGWWAVHNGTIANDKEYLKDAGVTPPTDVDSYAIPVAAYRGGMQEVQGLVGSQATLLVNPHGELYAYRNYKPLNILWLKDARAFLFSSLDIKRMFPEGLEVLFPPYSVGRNWDPQNGTCDVATEHPRNRQRGLVVCSGGLDSTTVAKVATLECTTVRLLHFQYGCRAEEKEVQAVHRIAEYLGVGVDVVPMGWLKRLGGSSLTDTQWGEVRQGVSGAEFAHEWVPARNTAMIGIAASYADRFDFGRIYLGLNLEEGGAYPDNTVEFYQKFNAVLNVGTQARPEIVNPLGTLTKRDIVVLAHRIEAPIHLSWSCYLGGALHCGTCGPCVMRQVAHSMLGLKDTISYSTPHTGRRP